MPDQEHVPDKGIPEKQQAYLDEIAKHAEVPLSMLIGVIGREQAEQLDEYQRGKDVRALIAEPLDPDFRAKDEKVAASIENNTAMYEDEIEDYIAEDSIVQALLKETGTDERTRALRARRTVTALLFSIDAVEPGATSEGAA